MSLASDEGSLQPTKADRSNWRTTPFSRWAFRNVREIIPVADIENGGEVWALPVRPEAFDDFRLRSGEGAFLSLHNVLQATATDGFVVLKDGCIVHEFYDHGTTATTPHILMSATKSVTGLIAGILQAQGVFDIDALVSHYVPEIAATAYRDASVRHLLDMRTGIVLNANELHAYATATNWEAIAPGESTIGLHGFFENLKAPPRAHGGPFSYVSASTDLLGWVIERATGKRFASLVSELIWKPMGAEQAAYITVDRDGAARCTGGFCATPRDFARLGQLIVTGGKRSAASIIPEALIEDIVANGDREAWKQGEFAASFGGRDICYRSGWYVINDTPKMIFAMGIHGQNLFVDRANRLVIAKLSSQGEPIDYKATALIHRAVAEIRRCLV